LNFSNKTHVSVLENFKLYFEFKLWFNLKISFDLDSNFFLNQIQLLQPKKFQSLFSIFAGCPVSVPNFGPIFIHGANHIAAHLFFFSLFRRSSWPSWPLWPSVRPSPPRASSSLKLEQHPTARHHQLAIATRHALWSPPLVQ
jgi:hypothetical protein